MALGVSFLGYFNRSSDNSNVVVGPYTQPANACIVVMATNITSINAPTDTLGNTYTPIAGTPISLATNSQKAGIWIVPNCLGGTNTITVVRGTGFGSWSFYYVTGADLVNPVNVTSLFEQTAFGTSVNVTAFSTTNPNTAILLKLANTQFGFTLPITVTPGTYTLDGSGNQGATANRIVSALQSGITPGFTWASGNVPSWIAAVAIQAPAAPAPPSGGGSGLGYDFRYRF
jgi:hypothetical protein